MAPVNNSSQPNSFNVNASVSGLAIVISFTALCSNIFMMIIIIRHRCFHKITFRLIFVTTITDIVTDLALTIYYTFSVGQILDFESGRWLCKVVIFTLSTSCAAWALMLCLVATTHYMLVFTPSLRRCALIKKYIVPIGQVTVAIVAVAISLPLLYYIDVYEDEVDFCDLPHVTLDITLYLLTHTVLLYCIPTTFLIIVYWKIIRYALKYTRIQPTRVNLSAWTDHRKKKLLKTFLFITIIDVIITIPYFATILCLSITQQSQRQIRDWNQAFFIFVYYSFATAAGISVINPILMLRFDPDLNAAVRELFRKFRNR